MSAGARLIAVVIGLALGPCGSAFAAVPRVKVGQPPFTEEQPKLRRYSADDLMGAVTSSAAGDKVGATIAISGIRPSDKLICVHIEQSSGGYRAGFTVPNPKLGGTVRFDLPSPYLQQTPVRPGEMAILAQASSNGRCSKGDPILPSSWGAVAAADVTIFINSQQADRVTAELQGVVAPCRKIGDALKDRRTSTSSFDTVCVVRSALTCPQEEALVVQLRDGLTYREPIRVSLRAPCGR